METLKTKNKITMATLKAFAWRNENGLFHKTKSSFDGMTDMVERVEGEWQKSEVSNDTRYCKTGILGIYTVGSSRDHLEIYDDGEYFGIEVYNCCGTTILAVKKQ